MKRLIDKLKISLLTIALMLSMIPAVFAGGAVDLVNVITGAQSDGTIKAGTTVYVTMAKLDECYGDFSSQYRLGNVEAYFEVHDGSFNNGKEYKVTAQDDKFSYTVKQEDAGQYLCFFTSTTADNSYYNNNSNSYKIVADAYIDVVSLSDKGILTVKGYTPGPETFAELQIYDPDTNNVISNISADVVNRTSFTKSFDVSKYAIGYHNLRALLDNGDYLYYGKAVPTYIYESTPSKKVMFCSGYNYISYRPGFSVPGNYDGVYMAIYKGSKLGGVYGPFKSYEILKTKYFSGDAKSGGTKLKANTSYTVKTFYGKHTKYGGKSYPFYGPMKSFTFKTGKSTKPSIKSIKITKAKQKKVTLIQHAHWDLSGNWVPYKKSYTWETTFKVTVKLKKKPGTKGIYIGLKKCKGNKKTYTATFTEPGKWIGKKMKVEICSYNDNTVGAYSKKASKKVKVKK